MKAPQRVLFRLEFDGSIFCGWQLQDPQLEEGGVHPESIQGVLERSLQTVLHLSKQERIVVFGCSRTDAGVHAREFFCHFDLPEAHCGKSVSELERLRHGMNCLLPTQIVITDVEEVPLQFHAQKSALEKTYEYRVLLRRSKPVLEVGRVWWLPVLAEGEGFDLAKLQRCLKMLEGTHDFASFMAAHSSVQSTVRNLMNARVELLDLLNLQPSLEGAELLRFRFTGEGFLKHQVRNMVGTLMDIAQGRRPESLLPELLGKTADNAVHDRRKAGYCAPPDGLYLVGVKYEAE
jgi:tRNA pseudouridine38-40 synthase